VNPPIYDRVAATHGDPLAVPATYSHAAFMADQQHDAWLRRVLAGKPKPRKRGKR